VLGERFVELFATADNAAAARELKPLDERSLPFGKTVMLFDGVPRERLAALGETRIPCLADLFVATMKGTYACMPPIPPCRPRRAPWRRPTPRTSSGCCCDASSGSTRAASCGHPWSPAAS